MEIASARFTTTDQNPALQLSGLKSERYKRIFIDTARGLPYTRFIRKTLA
jgi:hypothetical protein